MALPFASKVLLCSGVAMLPQGWRQNEANFVLYYVEKYQHLKFERGCLTFLYK